MTEIKSIFVDEGGLRYRLRCKTRTRLEAGAPRKTTSGTSHRSTGDELGNSRVHARLFVYIVTEGSLN